MNPPAVPHEDRDIPHHHPPVIEDAGDTIQEELRESLKKFSTSIPFVLLLAIRFLLSFVAKFFSLLFINIIHYRLQYIIDEQISLKSSINRNTLWTLFTVSLSTLSLVYLLSPLVLGINVVERLSFHRFGSENCDIISILMLCYFSDSTLRILLGAIKIAIYFMLNPRSRTSDNGAATPFPNFSCLRWNFVPMLSSFTPSGVADGLISLLPLRHLSRQRSSGGDVTHGSADSSGEEEEERDEETGQLLTHPGRRRRLVHTLSRERSSSTSSGASMSPQETLDHQSEVTSFMRLKKIMAAVDSAGAMYRNVMPIPVWMSYFEAGPGGAVLVVSYLFIKSLMSMDLLVLMSRAVYALVVEKLEFGTFATDDEVEQAGTPTCSICFENYYHPITLHCKHIFCQHCICEWLDHENSCPVCRAEVIRDNNQQSFRNLSASTMPVIM